MRVSWKTSRGREKLQGQGVCWVGQGAARRAMYRSWWTRREADGRVGAHPHAKSVPLHGFWLNLEGNEEPLQGFEQRSDVIRLTFWKLCADCCVENWLERGKERSQEPCYEAIAEIQARVDDVSNRDAKSRDSEKWLDSESILKIQLKSAWFSDSLYPAKRKRGEFWESSNTGRVWGRMMMRFSGMVFWGMTSLEVGHVESQ